MTITYKTELSTLINGDCVETMREMVSGGLYIDKVITSPPYNIVRPNATDRGYDLYKDGMSNEDYAKWIVDIFELYNKLIKPNGCILWNMSYGTENTTCMILTIAEIIKQTNWTLADILVWKKNSATPNNVSQNKMTRICEFVFVFSKGKPKTFNPIMIKSKWGGTETWGKTEIPYADNTFKTKEKSVVNEYKQHGNIFEYTTGKLVNEGIDHPAMYPKQLAIDQINTWTNKGDLVLDPFMGSGTTACAARERERVDRL